MNERFFGVLYLARRFHALCAVILIVYFPSQTGLLIVGLYKFSIELFVKSPIFFVDLGLSSSIR